MTKQRYIIEGRHWLPIARAAKLLRTNAQGIRKLMGEGKLDWRQTRANSRTFVVDEQAVLTMRRELPPAALKRSGAKARAPEPRRRVRGGLWVPHHLRVTLPVIDTDGTKA